MATMVLKVDVDTLRGTREGAPRLASLLARLGIPATFLFSVGPDHTGRALRRVFRRGFLSKVRRTSVVAHYGVRTLLYGVLLPGPDIGRRGREQMRAVAADGFEVGVHTHDHVRWQDHVAGASLPWTREELGRGIRAFESVFGFMPRIHGAAGWQMNPYVPALQSQFGIEVASDTRGHGAFRPVGGGPPQLPTTLPTLDELVGVGGASAGDAVGRLLEMTDGDARRLHVFTLHAELEGAAYLGQFERLLSGWRAQGYEFSTLGAVARGLDVSTLPECRIEAGTVDGRSGTLAVQGS